MAISACSRSLWICGAVIFLSLWFLLQSSSLSSRLNLVNEPLVPGQKNTELPAGGTKIGADVSRPGDITRPSGWGHDTSSTLSGAPQDGLDKAGQVKNKNPNEGTKPSDAVSLPQGCPVCSEPAGAILPVYAGIKETKKEDRPLILYAYSESDFARKNLQFFIDHGVHAAADFVFILNGPTDVDESIIFKDRSQGAIRSYDGSNIMVRKRNNSCFDLGAHAEVLNGVMGGFGWSDSSGPIPSPLEPLSERKELMDRRALKDKYKRYILMNASIRGPFVPLWSDSCWSDAYLKKLSEKIKLVGMSYNCHTDRGHVQSMIWATDSVGLRIILTPEGIDECFANMPNAQNGEIRTTQLLRDNGYDVDVFLSVYHSKDRETKQHLLTNSATQLGGREQNSPGRRETGSANALAVNIETDSSLSVPGDFWKSCTDEDWLGPGSYFGTFVHPYENLFMKSHRHIEDTVLDLLTEWHDGWGYSSYDVCF